MALNKEATIKVVIICLISVSFFLGYFLRENAVGGGLEFYKLSWPIIQSFKKDFFFTINNYGLFGDGTLPFSHIINAYINPFSNVDTHFQLSVTVISFLVFLIFGLVLKKIFFNINFTTILLTSSVILLLPFFRTSAFWGKNENYGWLFFILALYFFSEVKKDLLKNSNTKDIKNVIFFCVTSSCALYARQALIFLPISYFLYLFFYQTNKKILFISIISFILLAIPGLILIFLWRETYDPQSAAVLLPIGFNENWLHSKYILKNIPILLSFFGFYLFPILVIEFINLGFKNIFNKYFKIFFFVLLFFIILSQLGLLNYLGNYDKGGGAILKLNYLIQKNNFLLLLVFSSLGLAILVRLFKDDMKNNMIMILPMFIIFCFTHLLYQEYVEPLILIMFFLALNTNLHKIYFENTTLSHSVLFSYFATYLIGSIYFKHFVFDTHEKWKIFLNIQ